MSSVITQLQGQLGKFRPRTPFEVWLMDPCGPHRISEQSARHMTNTLNTLRGVTVDGEYIPIYTDEQLLHDPIDTLVEKHPSVVKAREASRCSVEAGLKKRFRRAMRLHREFSGVPEEEWR